LELSLGIISIFMVILTIINIIDSNRKARHYQSLFKLERIYVEKLEDRIVALIEKHNGTLKEK